jgi:hypothetical protein
MLRIILMMLVLSAAPATAQNFTTAAEIKPILGATKANWIAVREWEGSDLIYFTHLESWRCGLERVVYSVNGGEPQVWETEPCYEGEPAPNAMKLPDRFPYTSLPLKSVETVSVTVTYDDGSAETAEFKRAAVMTP